MQIFSDLREGIIREEQEPSHMNLGLNKCHFCDGVVEFWFFYRFQMRRQGSIQNIFKMWKKSSVQMICKSCYDEIKKKNIEKLLNNLDLQSRTCWKCKRDLNFDEYCSKNFEESPKNLVIIWQSPYIKILCCNCYDTSIIEEELRKKLNKARKIKLKLAPAEREALEFIDRKYGPLPLLSRIKYFDSKGFQVKDGHVVGLSLSNSRLVRVPGEISVFKHLKVLNLHGNLLENLPEWMEFIPTLEWVNLLHNEKVEESLSLERTSHIQELNMGYLIISKKYSGNYRNSETIITFLRRISSLIDNNYTNY